MFKNTRAYITAFLLLLLSSFVQAEEITTYWSASNNSNTQTINHKIWDDFLQKYVNTANDHKVRYKLVDKTDKNQLKNYIQQLTTLNPLEYNRAEQYAYWVNLYNAITINVVLDHYPVTSIKKIKLDGGFFTIGPWKSKVVTINNRTLSLDNIEHDILRPIWQDPRTHYAVNCASIGCPNLASQAYTAENTEALLEQSAIQFINSDKGVKLDNNKIILSKIYSWFKEDFGAQQANIFNHISQYADPDRKKALQNNRLNVNYRYNWDLNDDN